MAIPSTRAELVDAMASNFAKLRVELDHGGPRLGSLHCVDTWSVKDLLVVRAWWSEAVVDWIAAGQRGETSETPAPNYRWRDTPRLNADIVQRAARTSYKRTRERLEQAFDAAIATTNALDDRELLKPEMFTWAGKYPIARWLSMNTARQYATARTLIRKAVAAKK